MNNKSRYMHFFCVPRTGLLQCKNHRQGGTHKSRAQKSCHNVVHIHSNFFVDVRSDMLPTSAESSVLTAGTNTSDSHVCQNRLTKLGLEGPTCIPWNLWNNLPLLLHRPCSASNIFRKQLLPPSGLINIGKEEDQNLIPRWPYFVFISCRIRETESFVEQCLCFAQGFSLATQLQISPCNLPVDFVVLVCRYFDSHFLTYQSSVSSRFHRETVGLPWSRPRPLIFCRLGPANCPL